MDNIEELIKRIAAVDPTKLSYEAKVNRQTIINVRDRRTDNPGILTIKKIEDALDIIEAQKAGGDGKEH